MKEKCRIFTLGFWNVARGIAEGDTPIHSTMTL